MRGWTAGNQTVSWCSETLNRKLYLISDMLKCEESEHLRTDEIQ